MNKKISWSKYRSIEKRMLDVAFTGVENAINHYACCVEKNRNKQYVFDETTSKIGKGVESLNNYNPNKHFPQRTMIMKRKYRGKYYVYKITLDDITHEYDEKYKDPLYAFAAEKPSIGKWEHQKQVMEKGKIKKPQLKGYN